MLAGYDWSDIVSLGSYYSYGYSLILFPIFVLFKEAVMAYRIAVAVNFILLICIFFLLKWLTSKLFVGRKESTVVFYVAIAVFYPSWLFYARITLAEIVIVALYAVICALLYDYLERNRMSTLIMLVLTLVYIHFVHMRTIALLIACAVTLFLYFVLKRKKIKQGMVFGAVLISVFLIGFWLKDWITGNIYAMSDSVNTNDYAGQIGKLAYIFTKKGFVNLIVSVSGKILYLGIASFGLAYWGIGYACKQVVHAIKDRKKGKEIEVDKWFCLFVLLATAGATMVNAIYTISPGRVDALVYGRYHEYVMPILMIMGARAIEESKQLYKGLSAIFALEIVMTLLVTWSLHTYGQTNMHGFMMVGMSYTHQAENFEPIRFYWQAFGLGALLTFAVTFIFRFISRQKNMEVILILVLALELVLTIKAASLYLDASALGAYRDTKIVERIEELKTTSQDRDIYYLLDDNDYALISILQFMQREEDIKILYQKSEMETSLRQEDLLLIDYRNPIAKELEEYYDFVMVNGRFILYYNDSFFR